MVSAAASPVRLSITEAIGKSATWEAAVQWASFAVSKNVKLQPETCFCLHDKVQRDAGSARAFVVLSELQQRRRLPYHMDVRALRGAARQQETASELFWRHVNSESTRGHWMEAVRLCQRCAALMPHVDIVKTLSNADVLQSKVNQQKISYRTFWNECVLLDHILANVEGTESNADVRDVVLSALRWVTVLGGSAPTKAENGIVFFRLVSELLSRWSTASLAKEVALLSADLYRRSGAPLHRSSVQLSLLRYTQRCCDKQEALELFHLVRRRVSVDPEVLVEMITRFAVTVSELDVEAVYTIPAVPQMWVALVHATTVGDDKQHIQVRRLVVLRRIVEHLCIAIDDIRELEMFYKELPVLCPSHQERSLLLVDLCGRIATNAEHCTPQSMEKLERVRVYLLQQLQQGSCETLTDTLSDVIRLDMRENTSHTRATVEWLSTCASDSTFDALITTVCDTLDWMSTTELCSTKSILPLMTRVVQGTRCTPSHLLRMVSRCVVHLSAPCDAHTATEMEAFLSHCLEATAQISVGSSEVPNNNRCNDVGLGAVVVALVLRLLVTHKKIKWLDGVGWIRERIKPMLGSETWTSSPIARFLWMPTAIHASSSSSSIHDDDVWKVMHLVQSTASEFPMPNRSPAVRKDGSPKKSNEAQLEAAIIASSTVHYWRSKTLELVITSPNAAWPRKLMAFEWLITDRDIAAVHPTVVLDCVRALSAEVRPLPPSTTATSTAVASLEEKELWRRVLAIVRRRENSGLLCDALLSLASIRGALNV